MTTAGIVRYVITDDAALPEPELLLELPPVLGPGLGIGAGGFFILEELLLPISLLQEHRKSAKVRAR